MLFWLIHAGWATFGVKDYTPRLIALGSALFSLPLIAYIAHCLRPNHPRAKDFAPLILASFLCWLAYSTTVMFDLLLGLFTLAAIAAGLRATLAPRLGWFVVCGAMLGAGMLTKGPVILLNLLPVLILMPWWRFSAHRIPLLYWYGGLALAIIISAALMLAWVYPAVERGGPAIEHALIWKQTASRMAHSFAHPHPWYWYLLLLPALFFPWGVLAWKKVWRGRPWKDQGERFCMAWFGVSLTAFSMISGKQFHYLIPVMPAVALWLVRRYAARPIGRRSLLVVGTVLILFGLMLLFSPEWCELSVSGKACKVTPRLGAALPLLLGFFLLRASQAGRERMAWLAAVPTALLLVLLTNFAVFSPQQNVQPIANRVKQLQDEGATVVNVAKYHDQYQFAGRLEKPLVVRRQPALARWVPKHPDAYLIFYVDDARNPLTGIADAVYPYRSKLALIVPAKAWLAQNRHIEPG
ncbi:ArnT family glycosyltransferase [Marinobacter caseinilyticus]|uniref:ArnT family glycosyltransferase n=1 Tax=Marinobacter caseinilyticus TaxID=2692195 RepID=UPI0014080874|nr:glycosyltransferase family 39 protein [Marinobacter caseinilyticus]